MKKLLLFVMILSLVSISFAQDWEVVKESSMKFSSVAEGSFVDENTGWTIGDYNTIFKTTDGGKNWVVVKDTSGMGTIWLRDIEFINENVGYVCGDDGYILKTLDGGTTWSDVSDATCTEDFKFMDVVDENTVYFAGKSSTLLKTVDGGATYTKSDFAFGQDLDAGIAFGDANNGVVATDASGAILWYTTDGGATWTEVSLAGQWPVGMTSVKLKNVDMVGSKVVVVAYHKLIFISEDGGASFTLAANEQDYYFAAYYKNVDLVDANTIYAGGNTDGDLIKSTDGGATWTMVDVPTGETTAFFNFVDANTGFIFMYKGLWYRTTDGGSTLESLLAWPQVSLWDMEMPSDNKIIITSTGGELVISDDGGSTWNYPSNKISKSKASVYTCDFIDENNGFIGGSSGDLKKTTDGGETFTAIGNPMFDGSNLHINSFAIYDENTMFAGGSKGYVMKSSDGGATWSDTKLSSKIAYDIYPIDANTVLAAEQIGYLCYGVFDESNNVVIDSLIMVGDDNLREIGVSGNVVIIPTSYGNIYRGTLDDLANLTAVFVDPDGDDLYSVEFVTESLVYIVGEGGKIYKSEDAGLTWELQTSPITEVLQKVKFHNDKLWAVGQDGVILCLDMGPKEPYTLPITEYATDGTLDLDWVYNTYNGEGSMEVLDSTASAWGSHVIKYTDDGATGIAHVDRAVFQDYTISSDVYLVGPTDASFPLYAGITIKTVHDDMGYYRFVYRNSSTDNGILKLQGYDGSSWHISAVWTPGVDFDALETGFHNMKVTVVGNEFYAYIDGKLLPGCPKVDDSPVLSEGYPGIFIYNDPGNSVIFDNFMVTEPEEVGKVSGILINEFLASNDSSVVDENGNNDDYIELYNASDVAVNVGGLYIIDKLEDPIAWQIPTSNPELTTIEPGGFLVLWADKEPDQGVLHVDIKLSGDGEQIGLVQVIGYDTTYVDSLTFGAQTTDISYGRYEDGSDNWLEMTPTPGAANHNGISAIEDDNNGLPTTFALHQNYPNPFNPTTTIAFQLPKVANVRLTIYNMLGEKVHEMVQNNMTAGYYNYNFDASDLSSGIYIYSINAGEFTQFKKMTLIK